MVRQSLIALLLSECCLSALWVLWVILDPEVILKSSWSHAWRYEPERWRLSALDKLVLHGRTDRVTSWAPVGAKNNFLQMDVKREEVKINPTVLYLNLLQVKNRMLSRWRWCPRTWKGQQLMGKEAVCEYIWLATCQSKIYENKPPSAKHERRDYKFLAVK